jgi:hypothetical protein
MDFFEDAAGVIWLALDALLLSFQVLDVVEHDIDVCIFLGTLKGGI